ncbi:SRPBCC family protein [Planococcus shenhongbingii]|uniref:SRPBCC domain-containing protein n=1 Tax=Planococcus shenhongbingii TaxID=3058398 RepID=A0ABT8NGP2_9BACL|nr:SRPBCC domain-containing protein [Planococcus sp. N017]MDN7246889.1 SRPBCC domain-containing protein [Planococcus sp. N017]
MAITSTVTLNMARRFNAKSETVFAAWTNPETMKKWLFTQESTNKVAKSDLRIGGTWEIVDHREGVDYRATGEYVDIIKPNKLVFTFKMPQFSDTEDVIRVFISPVQEMCEMTFSQEIVVPHEEIWTEEDIERAKVEYSTQSEEGWGQMFEGLKQLVETSSTHTD